MEQRNNNQNSIIFDIEELLNKMSNQIRFLIRNEEPMSQLDLDLMMKNTRKLYDTLCSIDVKEEDISLQDNESTSQQVEEDISLQDYKTTSQQVEEDESLQDYKTTSQQVEDEDSVTQRLSDSETEEDDSLTPEDDDHADMVWDFTIEDAEEEDISLQVNESTSQQVEEEVDLVTQRLGDSATPNESLQDYESTSQQVIEEDSVTQRLSDSETKEDDLVTQRLGDSVTSEEEDSGIRAYRKTSNEHHTLGDVWEQAEDNSLAARLQRTAVSDLMTAIGINDKFLLLNELFSGSMEKYNKSIRALNSFSTLLGARTYMSELQIEFQWDCESEAYKKLSDLIERRFI
ncbi:MAG: hypothetical protein IJ961_03175 [Bacteroidales bacterium]|nr:hypothetical protein [Bacteroidales bacterium]